MGLKLVLVAVVLCVVIIETKCDTNGPNCEHRRQMPEFTRIKRAKYYSNPPQRFYKKPPMTYAIKGPFSYTPPPNYMKNDEPQYPPDFRPSKVSKKPTNDGLGDEDINNIVKYLSKTDLDKIMEFANEKERRIEKYRGASNNKYGDYNRPYKTEENFNHRVNLQELENTQRFSQSGRYVRNNPETKEIPINFNSPSRPKNNAHNDISDSQKLSHIGPTEENFSDGKWVQIEYKPNTDNFRETSGSNREKFSLDGPYLRENEDETQVKVQYNNANDDDDYFKEPKQSQKTIAYNQRFTYRGPYLNQDQDDNFQFDYKSPNPNIKYNTFAMQPEIIYSGRQEPLSNNAAFSNIPLDAEHTTKNYQVSYFEAQMKASKDGNIFTDSSVMKEEVLPLPLNLRQEDYEVADTKKAPIVVEAEDESSSYKVESFGELPLMKHYNSKLHTVSSYHVPHYTVTSPAPDRITPPHSSSSDNSPLLERAPPGADGKDQSDAHLKAIRIWTHKSKGTAYTLHKDGSLSLEAPRKPKPYHP